MKQNTTINLLDGEPTGVSGQGVIPGLQDTVGKDAVSGKLSRRHEDFCWAVVQFGGQADRAYRDVYPDVKPATARVNASRLLTNAAISARIDEILAEKRKRRSALVEKVIDYHQAVMNLNRFELLDQETGRFKRVENLPEEAHEVLELEQVSAKEGIRTLIKVPARHSSAQELAKILGMTKESVEISGPEGGPIEVNGTDPDALDKLRKAFDRHVSTTS